MLIKSPFARKLSLKIALATTVLLFSVLLIVTIFEVSITFKNCTARLDEQLQLCAGNIDDEFDAIKQCGDNIALMIDYVPADSISYKKVFTELLECQPSVVSIYAFLDPDRALQTGLVFPLAGRTRNGDSIEFKSALLPEWSSDIVNKGYQYGIKNVTSNPWYGTCFESAISMYIMGYGAVSPEVRNGGGCIVGIEVSINNLVKVLKSLDLYRGSVVYVVDHNNCLVCDSEHEIMTNPRQFDKSSLEEYCRYSVEHILNRDFDIQQYADSQTYNIEIDSVGSFLHNADFLHVVFNWNDVSILRNYSLNNGWKLYVSCPLKEVFSDVRKSLSIMGLGMIISIILLFFFCTRIIVEKAKPLKQFANASYDIAQGNFDAALPIIRSNDEVGQLRQSFEVMQVSLKQYIRDLEETTAVKQRMESEINIAAGIQLQALRKEFPDGECFDLYAAMLPAREVGGDLYDFVRKGEKLYVCVGDVSGKGVPAALLMMTTTMLFRQICTTSDRSLSEIASLINNCVADGNDSLFFVTLFVACINLDTLEMQYCNCGHNQILVVNPDGEAAFNKAIPNAACGVFENFRYVDEKIQLQKGSRVILYTDGVNEAKNVSNEKYGNRRLLEWANNTSIYEDEKSLVEGLLSSIGSFVGGENQSDDITMLSVRIKDDIRL